MRGRCTYLLDTVPVKLDTEVRSGWTLSVSILGIWMCVSRYGVSMDFGILWSKGLPRSLCLWIICIAIPCPVIPIARVIWIALHRVRTRYDIAYTPYSVYSQFSRGLRLHNQPEGQFLWSSRSVYSINEIYVRPYSKHQARHEQSTGNRSDERIKNASYSSGIHHVILQSTCYIRCVREWRNQRQGEKRKRRTEEWRGVWRAS